MLIGTNKARKIEHIIQMEKLHFLIAFSLFFA